MQNVEKVSVALTPEMAADLRKAVKSGAYASSSEVVREALRLWKAHESVRRQEVAQLRRLWAEGVASGPSVDGRKVFAEARALVRKRTKKSA